MEYIYLSIILCLFFMGIGLFINGSFYRKEFLTYLSAYRILTAYSKYLPVDKEKEMDRALHNIFNPKEITDVDKS
jgi:hypothetical protein